MGCDAVQILCEPTFRRNVLAICSRWFLARGFFYPEDGGDAFLRNVSVRKIYTTPHPRSRNSSNSQDFEYFVYVFTSLTNY
jgi:hypothetical protein